MVDMRHGPIAASSRLLARLFSCSPAMVENGLKGLTTRSMIWFTMDFRSQPHPQNLLDLLRSSFLEEERIRKILVFWGPFPASSSENCDNNFYWLGTGHSVANRLLYAALEVEICEGDEREH